jgi:hypothetical protein
MWHLLIDDLRVNTFHNHIVLLKLMKYKLKNSPVTKWRINQHLIIIIIIINYYCKVLTQVSLALILHTLLSMSGTVSFYFFIFLKKERLVVAPVVFKRQRDIFRDLPGIPSFTFQFYSTVLCFFLKKKEKRKTHFLLYSFYYYYYYYCFGVGIGWLTCMRCLLPLLQSPPALILHCN